MVTVDKINDLRLKVEAIKFSNWKRATRVTYLGRQNLMLPRF